MISVGDTPLEVDRVACFNSAVMGFGPILFDLPQESDLERVLKAVHATWENKESDEKLLMKWVRVIVMCRSADTFAANIYEVLFMCGYG